MLRHPRKISIEKDQDLHTAVDGVIADRAPRLLVRDGETVAVILSPEDYAAIGNDRDADLWVDYDPERARAALRACVGALAGVDREELLRDIHEARGQASAGRPD